MQTVQICDLCVHDDLVAVASSRLEGKTWNGALTLYLATPSSTTTADTPPSSPPLTLTRMHVQSTTYGIPALAWCGATQAACNGSSPHEPPLLAAGQDNGDVVVYKVGRKGGENLHSSDIEAEETVTLVPLTTLTDHDDIVSAVAGGREEGGDGKLATGGWDCLVKIWRVGMDIVQPMSSWQAHRDHVTDLAWRGREGGREGGGGGKELASAGRDRSVKLWDTRMEGESLRLVDAHPQIPLALAWGGNASSLPSSSSPPTTLPPGPSPPPGLEGVAEGPLEKLTLISNLNLKWGAGEGEWALCVGFDDGSVEVLDLRLLPREAKCRGRGGRRRGVERSNEASILPSQRYRMHQTRTNALAPASCGPGASSEFLLASGGDDGVVTGMRVKAGQEGGENQKLASPPSCGRHADYVRGLSWLDMSGKRGRHEKVHPPCIPSQVLLSGGWDGHVRAWTWVDE